MNFLLTILIAQNSEGEYTFWMQMLVIVILGASFGIYGLAKARANKFKGNNRHRYEHRRFGPSHSGQLIARDKLLSPTPKVISNISGKNKFVIKELRKSVRGKQRDLHSGMELLGLDFLLRNVENINGGNNEQDVTIRKLNFKELQRRDKLNQTESKALKIYAINKGNLYGKDIQCEAMKSLAERTAKSKTGN